MPDCFFITSIINYTSLIILLHLLCHITIFETYQKIILNKWNFKSIVIVKCVSVLQNIKI